jgi:serine/threonine protein kinase
VDKLVLVMEYIAGGTLYSLLRKKKRFFEKLAATLLQGISISLNEMHRFKLVQFNIFIVKDLFIEI